MSRNAHEMTPLAQRLVHLPLAGRGVDPLQERLRREYERGVAESVTAADRRAEERLAAQAREMAAAHEAERVRWTSEQGDKLARSLATSLATLQANLRDEVARLLRPFLENELRRQSVAEFTDALGTLLRHDKAARIAIRGPADLIERIVTAEVAPFCDVTVCEECEIIATCGATAIEMHLRDWLAAFERGEA
jgi:hypothetical protein